MQRDKVFRFAVERYDWYAHHEKQRQGKVLIRNWHALNWETEEQIAKKKGVDKRGATSQL